jgi:hypothetical protein
LRPWNFNRFNDPNFALPSNVFTPEINADGTKNRSAGPAGSITPTPDVVQGNTQAPLRRSLSDTKHPGRLPGADLFVPFAFLRASNDYRNDRTVRGRS